MGITSGALVSKLEIVIPSIKLSITFFNARSKNLMGH